MERDATFWREQAERLADELSATQGNLAAILVVRGDRLDARRAVYEEQKRISEVLAAYAIALVQP